MPSRNLVYEALILRMRESPAGDRILTLMTAEAGLMDVFVFGGPKSKLRSLASPFASGRAFVYADPAKDFRKLSDFEVRDFYPALREELGRLWAAGLVAELLIKTSGGGGDFPPCSSWAGTRSRPSTPKPPGRSDYAVALFLWRLVALLGLAPDAGVCVSCGRELRSGLGGGSGPDGKPGCGRAEPCAYSFGAEGFLCETCAAGSRLAPAERSSEELLPLGPAALSWLRGSEGRPFHGAVSAGLDEGSLRDLKTLVFGLARRAAEAPLAYLASGFLLP